jgi:hypothetical protein
MGKMYSTGKHVRATSHVGTEHARQKVLAQRTWTWTWTWDVDMDADVDVDVRSGVKPIHMAARRKTSKYADTQTDRQAADRQAQQRRGAACAASAGRGRGGRRTLIGSCTATATPTL